MKRDSVWGWFPDRGAKSAAASASLKKLHSRSEDSWKLMGVHITHNLVEEKGA